MAIEIIKTVLKKENIRVLIVVPKNVILETGWYKELYDAGFGLPDIGVYYGAIKEYAKITITNMQNLKNIEMSLFDFIIFDEVHNMASRNALPYVQMKIKYKLGLTATIERHDNKHWDLFKAFDFNVFKYGAHQALVENVINEFNFFDIAVQMDEDSYERYQILTTQINSLIQAGGGFNKILRGNSPYKASLLQKMGLRKQLVNNYVRKFDVVLKICLQHSKDKIIVFNEFNDQTNKLYYHLLEGELKPCIYHSSMDKEKGQDNLMQYKKDKYNILLATRAVEEGYNLPKIDTGIIMACNSTKKQTIQRLGRVLRKKDKPSNLYQIYCLGTIEEQYAKERTKFFKSLCNIYNYSEYKLCDEQ